MRPSAWKGIPKVLGDQKLKIEILVLLLRGKLHEHFGGEDAQNFR